MCGALTATAAGKGNKKGGNKKGGNKPEPEEVAPATDDPFEGLQPFIQNVDQLLRLNRTDKAIASFANEAPGRMILLRGQFATQRAAAPPTEHPRFDAGLATCDAISSSLDERKKFVAQLEAAKAVGTSNKLRTRKEAKKTADAFNEAARNRWTQRSIELRQQIQAAYARIATAGTP